MLFIVAVSFSFLDCTTSEAPGSVESRCRSEMSYYVVLSLGSANQIFTVKSVIRRRRGERGCVGDGVDVCDKVCYPPQLYGAPAASDQHCEEADVIRSPTPPGSCTPQSPSSPPARALFFELIRVIRRICRVARFYAFGSMKERYRIQITHAATRKVQGKSGIVLFGSNYMCVKSCFFPLKAYAPPQPLILRAQP